MTAQWKPHGSGRPAPERPGIPRVDIPAVEAWLARAKATLAAWEAFKIRTAREDEEEAA